MSSIPPLLATDRECLHSWARRREAENLRPIIERYLPFVYSSAFRRTGDAAQAAEVTRAVFLVLARRARKLGKRTVLARWLFDVTKIACRKVTPRKWWPWFRREPRPSLSADATLWMRVAPEMDRALELLRPKQRNAVLLCGFLNHDFDSAAKILRTRERRVNKRLVRGISRLSRRFRKCAPNLDAKVLAVACAAEGCAAPVPSELCGEILRLVAETCGQRPSLKLARRTLNKLAWRRWARRFAIGIPTFAVVLAIAGGIGWHISSLTGHSRLIATGLMWKIRFQTMKIAEPARPWPTGATAPPLDATIVRNAETLYRTTNIWLAHLNFTRSQWNALEPRRIGPMPNFMRADGMIFLRNPQAQRSGLAGVFGYDFDWTHGDFEIGGIAFTNVGVRTKGNGSWLGSWFGPKHAFKVDLNKFAKGQKLGGLDELTLNNLIWGYSYLEDALGYEFFRESGVPAPRTAYVWLSASVTEQWDRKPLGLYLLVEPVDEAFVGVRFGSRKTPVFKPVTYELFKYLGDEWSAYAPIYDLKTKATPEQQQRVIEFARLVSSASDTEFAAHVGEFLDLDEFARFLAAEVLLSNYDSILADGQNFYMYLDPRSNKFGFIPWDLDAGWGEFWIASKPELERASIWHPWVGENRFIERVMTVEEFRHNYRGHLEDFLTRFFLSHRLHRRIDEIAAVIRDPVAAESSFRLNKFEQSVGLKPVKPSPGETLWGVNHPAHDLKRFIEKRAKSVRLQLDGKSKGMILTYPSHE
jgi:DNA-directed RNA polymerase specialized sigma24 family protein